MTSRISHACQRKGILSPRARGWRALVAGIFVLALCSSFSFAEERVQRFKPPEFRKGYVVPPTKSPATPSQTQGAIDAAVLAGFLAIAAYLILKRRSRKLTFLLTLVAGIAYFGFYKKGCICPVGSIQNVSLAIGPTGYVLPWTVAAVFLLPLLFSLFFGRVFCSGVCPLGAIQDIVLFRPIRVPPWIEMPLGLVAFAYLGLAVLFAMTGSDFFICRYDPFVGLYRMSGPSHMILAGLVFLAMCMFIGRLYCRFLCPYSVLLRILAIFAIRKVTITPAQCVDCRLCEESCPFGAIRYPAPHETARDYAGQRKELAYVLAALPIVIGLCTLLGWLGAGALSRMDFTVQLAEEVKIVEDAAQRQAANDKEAQAIITRALQGQQPLPQTPIVVSDRVKAFGSTGQSPEQLFASAAAIQGRFAIGAPLFGAWMGLAIGGRVLGLLMRRRKSGYTADAAACVACARCYAHCPVENDVKLRQREEAMVTV